MHSKSWRHFFRADRLQSIETMQGLQWLGTKHAKHIHAIHLIRFKFKQTLTNTHIFGHHQCLACNPIHACDANKFPFTLLTIDHRKFISWNIKYCFKLCEEHFVLCWLKFTGSFKSSPVSPKFNAANHHYKLSSNCVDRSFKNFFFQEFTSLFGLTKL